MTTHRTDQLLTILQECFNPREDGWLWLASYVDDQEGGVVAQFEGAYEHPAATGRGLARIVTDSAADRCYVALCRREGRPRESDREMWRLLRDRTDANQLIDMVVFNRETAWSMREEDATAAAAAAATA